MRKAKIHKQDDGLWVLTYSVYDKSYKKAVTDYEYQAILNVWIALEKNCILEQCAWAKIYKLVNDEKATVYLKEVSFIEHLVKTGCKDITIPQYGYLSGIYERNYGDKKAKRNRIRTTV